jgi:hypothetical protein
MRTSFKVAQKKALARKAEVRKADLARHAEVRKADMVKAQALAVKGPVVVLKAAVAVKAVEKAPKEPAAGYQIKQRPPPAGVRRGGPGGWMLAQAPRKYDQDGKPIGAIEYSEVYVAP